MSGLFSTVGFDSSCLGNIACICVISLRLTQLSLFGSDLLSFFWYEAFLTWWVRILCGIVISDDAFCCPNSKPMIWSERFIIEHYVTFLSNSSISVFRKNLYSWYDHVNETLWDFFEGIECQSVRIWIHIPSFSARPIDRRRVCSPKQKLFPEALYRIVRNHIYCLIIFDVHDPCDLTCKLQVGLESYIFEITSALRLSSFVTKICDRQLWFDMISHVKTGFFLFENSWSTSRPTSHSRSYRWLSFFTFSSLSFGRFLFQELICSDLCPPLHVDASLNTIKKTKNVPKSEVSKSEITTGQKVMCSQCQESWIRSNDRLSVTRTFRDITIKFDWTGQNKIFQDILTAVCLWDLRIHSWTRHFKRNSIADVRRRRWSQKMFFHRFVVDDVVTFLSSAMMRETEE